VRLGIELDQLQAQRRFVAVVTFYVGKAHAEGVITITKERLPEGQSFSGDDQDMSEPFSRSPEPCYMAAGRGAAPSQRHKARKLD
jgi:hypothetical protein